MHVVEPEQHLLRNLLDDVHWDALILVTLNQPEQILAEHLKHHADMGSVRALMAEVV